MTKVNLTPAFCDSRKPAKLKDGRKEARDDYPDGQVPGMALRVTDTGHKSFVLIARYPLNPKNPTRRALGDYIPTPKGEAKIKPPPVGTAPGPVMLAQGRERARMWLELIAQGIDPKTEAESERLAVMQKQANSVAAVVKDFLDQPDTKKFAKYNDCQKCLNDFVKRCGSRPITDSTSQDVTAAIKAVMARGAMYQAHNYSGYVRQLLNWAIGTRQYGLSVSPMQGLDLKKLIGKRESRDRILNDGELRLVWGAAEELQYPYGPLVRLLILNGQREREDGDMTWPEIDFGKELLTIPPQRMKGDRAHVVPLAPEALKLLMDLDKLRREPPKRSKEKMAGGRALPFWDKGAYVFSGSRGEKPVNGYSKAKDRIDVVIARRGEADAAAAAGSLRIEKIEDDNVRIIASRVQPFKEADVGRVIGIRHNDKWGYARLTEFTSASIVEARIVVPFSRLAESDVWVWGIEAWVWHDMRRTARTHFSALPVQDIVRELVIAHAKPNLHKVYDQWAYIDEKRECLTLWEQRLKGILSPPTPADVADLSEERANRSGKS